MKASNAISTKTNPQPAAPEHKPTNRSSRIIDGFVLRGSSEPPDPAFAAYRPDLADIALAGTIVASHYAVPLPRLLVKAAWLRSGAAVDSPVVAELDQGAPFEILECTSDWAWGYGGVERRVGYVPAAAIASASS